MLLHCFCINFNGKKTVSSVIVYSMQDNHYTPIDPPDGLTFSKYGIPSFNVQIRNGASWTTIATVSGNYPSGLIHFYDGVTSLGDPVALVNGSASLSSASLDAIFTTPGSHTIKADYAGDRNNIASSSTSQVQVNGPMLVPLLMLLLDEN